MRLQRSHEANRRRDMTSDAGWTSQESDAARPRPDVLRARQQLQQPPRRVTRPEEREAFARAGRQRPARLGSVWVGPHLQPARDADTCQAAPAPRVRQWPQPRPNEGKVPGMERPVHGIRMKLRQEALPSASKIEVSL